MGDRFSNGAFQGKTAWGNIIGKFFLNRRVFSVSVDQDVPLFVSLNASHGFCLEARYLVVVVVVVVEPFIPAPEKSSHIFLY